MDRDSPLRRLHDRGRGDHLPARRSPRRRLRRQPRRRGGGRRLLHIVVLCFPLLAVAFVLSRAFAGAGNTLPSMAVAAVAHLAWQLPMVHALGTAYGPVGAWWGMSSAFMVHGLLAAGVYIARYRPAATRDKEIAV
ncbi:MAG: hypothetical protein R3F43_02275 [bacterium]